MFGFAWLGLRQAKSALKCGRLEEAQRLLREAERQGRDGATRLLALLARAYVERGERQLRLDDAEGAWRDLLAAEALLTGEKTAGKLREALARLGIAEVRAALQAGEPARADDTAGRLRSRQVRSPELQVLEDGARGWISARELADRGEFARAVETADRTRRLLGSIRPLDEWRDELEKRRLKFSDLQGKLHEAADGARWGEALELAEQVIAAAPEHAEARKVRVRAWKAVEPVTVAQRHTGNGLADNTTQDGSPARVLLWIDGIGGFLVCLAPRVTFGQAAAEALVDVPLVADVSRLHATLTRDAEGYLLEGIKALQVNSQPVTRALLRQGDRVTLGTSCQFVFRQPVPVSTTARLDIVSGHRLPLAVDGVLLMGDSLVLGPGPQAHIVVPDLNAPVVLFRHKEGLGVRGRGPLTVNGERCGEKTLIRSRSVVSGEEIAFAVEPAGTRLGQG
jgi:tetratricopeptide (TPR) repeat protein